jgi:glycosyltransferase involved in cell wall biosynthesis
LGAFVEVIGDAGVSFRAGDAQDLSKQIIRLIRQPQLVQRIARAAQERAVEDLHFGQMIQKHKKLYCSVARPH